MSDIDLQAGKIKFEGEWLSAQDLSNKIQEKMDASDMKFSSLASALEELNKALENSHTIETRIVIPKEQYKKLKALGGNDERECLLKAIKAFIKGGVQMKPAPGSQSESYAEPSGKIKKIIKCAKCSADIEINEDKKPTQIKCPVCNAVGRLKS